MKSSRALNCIAIAPLVIGGLNWLLVGASISIWWLRCSAQCQEYRARCTCLSDWAGDDDMRFDDSLAFRTALRAIALHRICAAGRGPHCRVVDL